MPKHTLRYSEANAPDGLTEAILNCNSIAEMRTLAPLPVDAQRQIDSSVVSVGRQRLVIANDILAEGLVYNLPDPLSVMQLYWEKTGRAGHAHRTMLPDARGERAMPLREGQSIPIYITMEEFSFNIRVLRAAQRTGAPLDTTMVAEAARNINEAIEDAIIYGAGINVHGYSAPGLLSSGANINTQSYVDNEAWTAANHSGEDILTDVLNMIDVLIADNYYGPYNLYIPTNYGSKLNQDYKSATSGTIRQRLEELEAGGRGIRIRVADQLPANRTVLMQMTSDVIDMVVGQTPTMVSWEGPSGFRWYGVVMAIMVHRIKSTQESQSGIVVGNTT